MENITIKKDLYKELLDKAARWDALVERIEKCYDEESESDLGEIGEIAAIATGYL